ncbi:hypothetical protein M758_9G060300 [Ceratodon purpureus]|nr:hypothetical protein M758_9G060300 [Ceratodon purpureus]
MSRDATQQLHFHRGARRCVHRSLKTCSRTSIGRRSSPPGAVQRKRHRARHHANPVGRGRSRARELQAVPDRRSDRRVKERRVHEDGGDGPGHVPHLGLDINSVKSVKTKYPGDPGAAFIDKKVRTDQITSFPI